jgi:hypothetical protein
MPTLQGVDTVDSITQEFCAAAKANGAQFVGA